MDKPIDICSDTEQPAIAVQGLKKYFTISNSIFGRKKQMVKAVDNITLNINKGEIVGLVGESGSGKTTLARVILNLIQPTEGSVIVDGVDMTRATKEEKKRLRSEIAVVFQDPASNLNPRQTVVSSIMRPMILHGKKKTEAIEKAHEALNMVKMDERYLNSYPHQLSGGQLQRIAIARALVLEPKIMILDEPTSALDISVQAQILNLLLDLQESMKLTYLVITHDLNVIRYISDRVAVMYLGKLMEFGPTTEVLGNPKHPYTHGLMTASPILDPKLRGNKKNLMGGDPGSLMALSDGCRFSKRCAYATERCKNTQPGDYRIGSNHIVSCFLYER